MDPAWITAATALLAIVGGLLAWCARWTWRILKRITRFLDDYFGEPAREGVPARPGVMARLSSAEKLLARVLAEMQPNGGNSLRDDVVQTAQDVAAIKTEQAAMRTRIELFEKQRAGREGGKP